MDGFMREAGGIALAIVGLAIVAVLVSRNAQTGSVITSAGNAFSGAIGAAVAPVSGGFGGYGGYTGNSAF
jgi:hypothetical protein